MDVGFPSRFPAAIAVLICGWMFSPSASAQSCPDTLPNIVLGASTGGASYVRNISLRSQMPNADGTVTLCRYSGTKYITPTGGSEQSQGSYAVDRISAASGVNDPSNAWVVKLFDLDGKHECTGSAILPNWVITAGHCAAGSPSVAVGSSVFGGVTASTVRRCFYLPKYTCFNFPNPATQIVQVSKVNVGGVDVALLRLASPLVLTRYGTPAAASSYNGDEVSGKQFTWQCNDANANKTNCPTGADALASYTVTFWRDDKCKLAILGYKNQLCSTGRTPVGGDSGGPLVYKSLIVGLLSGQGGPVGSRAIFTDVSQLGPWIGKVTNQMQPPVRL